MLGKYEGKVVERYEKWRSAPLNWMVKNLEERPSKCFELSLRADLGLDDASGRRFETMSEKMLSGDYYPSDAIDFFGPWQGRLLRAGDRILQCANVFGMHLWAMTEVYVAEKSDTHASLGYVTTKAHFIKGIWNARLIRENRRIYLEVKSFSLPNSLLYSLGLGYGRSMQKRAAMLAIESMTQIG